MIVWRRPVLARCPDTTPAILWPGMEVLKAKDYETEEAI